MCYICGRGGKLHKHHIFGGNPNRGHSEDCGLTVHLCPKCHTIGKEAVHKDAEIMEGLHKIGQAAFERNHTREEFVRIFGKNYLPEPHAAIPYGQGGAESGIIGINDDDS